MSAFRGSNRGCGAVVRDFGGTMNSWGGGRSSFRSRIDCSRGISLSRQIIHFSWVRRVALTLGLRQPNQRRSLVLLAMAAAMASSRT
jgi:hypothetical protein